MWEDVTYKLKMEETQKEIFEPWTNQKIDQMIKKNNKKIEKLNKIIKGLRFCPDCKGELVRNKIYLESFHCGNCLKFYQSGETLSYEESCKHDFKFICKKHEDKCKTYVREMCNDLNKNKITLDKRNKCLLKEICTICGKEK